MFQYVVPKDAVPRPTIRSAVKHAIDSWFPGLGLTYRSFREGLAPGSPVMTPFGFELAGSDLMATGDFEREEIDCFLQYLPAAAACIDVGANVGLYSCLAASRGKHVVAVEPLVSNLRVLLQNLFRNGFVDAEVYPLGLASAPGIARLYGGGTGASFLPGWADTPENWNRIVPLTTLDILTGTRFDGRPLFIKVDVEGFELEVLKGSKRILAMDPRPIWMVEICLNEHFHNGLNDRFYETFELFWRHGYQSRVAVLQRRIVQPEDVARWVARGSVDFGSHNYVFAPA